MDDKDIDVIKDIVEEVIEEAISKRPVPKDETVVLCHADGRRVELHSNSESINALLIKGSKKIEELGIPKNNTKDLPGEGAWG